MAAGTADPMSPQFSYGNSSHVECPHRPGEPRGSGCPVPRYPLPLGRPLAPRCPRALSLVAAEPAWNVSLSVRGLQLRLHLTSSVPASFSAALCQRRGGQCEPEAPVYTVTRVSGAGPGGGGGTGGAVPGCADPASCFAAGGLCPGGAGAAAAGAGPGQLRAGKASPGPVVVPAPCGGQPQPPSPLSFPQVWRSDVRFARKQLLCPDGERGPGAGGRVGGVSGLPPHRPSPSLTQALRAAGAGAGAGAGGDRAAPELPRRLEATRR